MMPMLGIGLISYTYLHVMLPLQCLVLNISLAEHLVIFLVNAVSSA